MNSWGLKRPWFTIVDSILSREDEFDPALGKVRCGRQNHVVQFPARTIAYRIHAGLRETLSPNAIEKD